MFSIDLGDVTGSGRRGMYRQHRFNKQYMKNSIQWRAEDARAAGIHPLAAMGASVSTPSASAVGGDGPRVQADFSGNRSLVKAETRLKNAQASELEQAVKASEGKRLQVANNAQQDVAQVEAFPVNPGSMKVPLGRQFHAGPTVTQQTVEDQYGNIAGEAYGLTRLTEDIVRNLNRVLNEFFVGETKPSKKYRGKIKRGEK